MKNLKFTILCLLAFSFTLNSFAQKKCGTDQIFRQMVAEDPQILEDIKELLESNKKFIQNKGEAMVTYTIPIVFHILHQYGNENMDDSFIYKELEQLNEDFNKLNADQSIVIPQFTSLIANCNFVFRLPTLDPDGNCTNGIDHIFTHETNNGQSQSKLNQWPRNKYINVWTAAKIGVAGAAAYALFPGATVGPSFKYDGVMSDYTYVGKIAGKEHTITHEIGHMLSLNHPWGGTNDCEAACGDDGIEDTPDTEGFCPGNCPIANPNDAAICNPGVIENFQNFMDYSYCTHMFTLDQAATMEATLNSSVAYRDNLWKPANLAATGVNAITFPGPVSDYTDANIGAICSPVADFTVSGSNAKLAKAFVCYGENLTFTASPTWRAKATTWSWTFDGGTPSSSTTETQVVTYNSPGWHKVSLTAGNAVGSTTKTDDYYVYVSQPYGDFAVGYNENFETGTAYWWNPVNPENNEAAWSLTGDAGYSGTNCYMLNNFTQKSTDYSGILGGSEDALISPLFDLRFVAGGTLSFKYSCATTANASDDITEKLVISISTNCGESWLPFKTISGGTLSNAGNFSSDFKPESQNQWTSSPVYNIPPNQLKPEVRFKFEYVASDFSNNLYIDDINVSGTNVETGEIYGDYFSFNVYPNPVGGEENLNIAYYNHGEIVRISIIDVLGREVFSTIDETEGNRLFTLNKKENNLSSGMYFVSISGGTIVQAKKVFIQ